MVDLYLVNLATGQSSTMAPLGALYVAGALEKAGYRLAFRDYALERGPDLFGLEHLASFLTGVPAPLVGISCFASMLPYAVEAAALLRRERPDVRIVLGGPGPSAVAAEILDAFPAIDCVVFGEGEETAVELVDAVIARRKTLDGIEGLAWRRADGTVALNAPRARRPDIDAIPFPAYHHVKLSAYDVVGLVYSRGCPYACTYCDVVSMWKRRNIARSLPSVLAEIGWLHQTLGVRHIAFVDDLFTVDRSRVLAFCEAFQAAGCPVSWGCTTRIDRVDEPLLEAMAAAGCTYVFYGVESGSRKILARVNKVIPFEQTVRMVQTSVQLGMYVHTPLMWGFPFEDMRDFRETLAFGRYLTHCGAHVFYTLATPLPATELYREFRGRLAFNPQIYSTIIAPGRTADLSPVEGLIRRHPDLFPGFYLFADGRVEEKAEIGRALGLNLSDIRISNLAGEAASCP